MSQFATTSASFVVAAAVSLAATPVAICVARRTDFLDRPRQYRQHKSPTPLLGGAAVLVAVLLAGLLVAGASGKLLVPLGCAVGLWALGTIDDKVALRPKWRVLAESGAAAALVAVGLGWNTNLPLAGDFVLTLVWTVGVVNAFNLMDNLDGACSTVGAVAAAGIGALAVVNGETALAGLAFAVSGACAGFLPWNLSGPAKIFLGDGGSIPLGFLIAALAMAAAGHPRAGNAGLVVGALLVGLPILDTALVSFSRTRRGVSVLTGGRDHLSHRLLLVLGTPRLVAGGLAVLQGVLCAIAILGFEVGTAGAAALGFAVFLMGTAAILVLDSRRWRPAGIAIRGESAPPQPASAERVGIDSA